MAQNGNGTESYSVPFWINGEEVHPEKKFDVVSPATGKVVHQCGSATETEVKAAIEAAETAFKTWKKTLPKVRRDIFLKAAEVIERRNDELGQYMMDETGAPKQWADFNLMVARDFLFDMAGRVSSLEGAIPTTQDPSTGALVLREPFGVVLAVAAW
jgi:acyl-CoA reductase-like NAD-dependent aldehyde dehydrogenase